MNRPAHPMPKSTPPAATSTSTASKTYMAPMRHADPANTRMALNDTSMRRAPCGKRYDPTALATNAPQNASDCARKKVSVTSAVWNSIGRNGNTPPQMDVAFTVRKHAYPQLDTCVCAAPSAT